jgi:HK97 family phage major capsid protein
LSIEQVEDLAGEKIAELTAETVRLKEAVEKAVEKGEPVAELQEQFAKARTDINDLVAAEQKRTNEAEGRALLDEMKEAMKGIRTPSKAHLIGNPKPQGDDFHYFSAVAKARSMRVAGSISAMQEGEEELKAHGLHWEDVPPEAKATLGDTDAAGGYLVPNNIVADLVYQATALNPYRSLLTVVSNLRGSAVDIPLSSLAPSRATIVAPGVTKDNRAFSLTNYTATLYTLATIYDVGNQFLRQSAGAAETLVRRELGQAMALGESWYILNGTGTAMPYGLLTALGTSGTYVTSHTAAQTTIAGNFASAIAKASGDLANRSRVPDGVVMNSGNFFTAIASGDNTAGFYISPTGGAVTVDATGGFANGRATPALRIWGIPVYADPNMPSDSLVVGDWSSAQLFLGQGYRVDVSSEAGDRWDKNLTGFRAEEEIAFDARPYVFGGSFQRVIDVVA